MTHMLDIIGQPGALASLRSALKADRVPHAWLFYGPKGIGKFTTALSFATVLLDPDATIDADGNATSDPTGPTAQRVKSRLHPDLHIITKELAQFSADDKTRRGKQTNIPIKVVNEFILEPAFRSGHGTTAARASKVFIIDEAEMLDATGQNRLLKTLEEPPDRTVLILISTSEDRILPTIRSRCRLVSFGLLNDEQVRHWLSTNKVDVPPQALDFLLRFSDGSPGQLQTAIQYGLDQWYEALAPTIAELNAGRYPVHAGTTMGALVDELAQREAKKKKEASKKVANRLGASLLFTMLSQELRRAIRAAATEGESIEPLVEVLSLLARAESQIASNANLKLVLENVVVQWADVCGRQTV